MDDAGFRIFLQRGDRANGNAVRINTVHALFLDVCVAIFFPVFVHACSATPHPDDVIGIRRQFVVVRPGLFAFRVTGREVDILTLGDTGGSLRTASSHRASQENRDRRTVFCSRMTDGRRCAQQQCPLEAALIKLRLFTVILPVSQRYLSFADAPVHVPPSR